MECASLSKKFTPDYHLNNFVILGFCMLGKLIVIEGCDATGKHTQSELLFEKLKESNFDAVLVSFPRYKTIFG